MSRVLKLAKAGGHILVKNSPAILTGVAVVGVITTAIMAVKAVPVANALIEQEENRRWEETHYESPASDDIPSADTGDLTNADKVRVTWKVWLPPVASGALTITAIILANRIQSKRLALAVSAYSLAEVALQEYQDATRESLGDKAFETVKDKIAEERVRRNSETLDQVHIPDGQVLWIDAWSGRVFTSSMEEVQRGINRFNHRLINDMDCWISMNELYSELNLEAARVGDIIGWTPDRLVELDVRASVRDDRVPVLVLDYVYGPTMYPHGR